MGTGRALKLLRKAGERVTGLCSGGRFSNIIAFINVENRKCTKEYVDLTKEIPSRIYSVDWLL